MYHDYYDASEPGLRNPYDPDPPAAERRRPGSRLVVLGVVGGLTVGITAATAQPATPGPAAATPHDGATTT